MSLVLCMAEMWAFCRGKPRDVLGLGSSCWLLARPQADCPADGGEASGRGFAPASLQNAGGMQVIRAPKRKRAPEHCPGALASDQGTYSSAAASVLGAEIMASATRPALPRIARSIASATAGLSLRKDLAFSRPWPMR